MQYIQPLIQYLLPKYCLLCDMPSEIICRKCFSFVFKELPSCYICGRISTGFKPHATCLKERDILEYDFVFCAWRLDKNGARILRMLEQKDIYSGWEYMVEGCSKRITKIERYKFVSSKGLALAQILSKKYLQEDSKGFVLVCNCISQVEKMNDICSQIRRENPEAKIGVFALFGVDKTKLIEKVGNVNPVQT